jgi:hypothetical protein
MSTSPNSVAELHNTKYYHHYHIVIYGKSNVTENYARFSFKVLSSYTKDLQFFCKVSGS